jgi:hypothetical protein
MDTASDSGYASHTGSVRILTSPAELAEAISRAWEFERRNAEFMASRTQRHEAALARLPSRSWETPWTASREMAASEDRTPTLPASV